VCSHLMRPLFRFDFAVVSDLEGAVFVPRTAVEPLFVEIVGKSGNNNSESQDGK
jgi:hypothetical protein